MMTKPAGRWLGWRMRRRTGRGWAAVVGADSREACRRLLADYLAAEGDEGLCGFTLGPPDPELHRSCEVFEYVLGRVRPMPITRA
jgi:hypothetical protein